MVFHTNMIKHDFICTAKLIGAAFYVKLSTAGFTFVTWPVFTCYVQRCYFRLLFQLSQAGSRRRSDKDVLLVPLWSPNQQLNQPCL